MSLMTRVGAFGAAAGAMRKERRQLHTNWGRKTQTTGLLREDRTAVNWTFFGCSRLFACDLFFSRLFSSVSLLAIDMQR
jgi:hypothetical protein